MWTSFLDDYDVVHGEDMGEGRALTGLKTVGTATATSAGPPSDFMTGSIDLTGQKIMVDNVLHLFAKLSAGDDADAAPPGAAEATIEMYFQPGDDEKPDGTTDPWWYFIDSFTTTKDRGDRFDPIINLPEGTYQFAVTAISASTMLTLRYAASV